MILSAFADEISHDLTEQLDVLESEGIRHIEFRGVWKKNVLDLSDEELARVKEALDARGFRLSAVGSPIGKIGITDSFEPHLQRFERAIQVANFFDCEYIRIFSFFIPEGDDPTVHRDEVMRRMKQLVDRAAAAGKVLLHENEKAIYGESAACCVDLLRTMDSQAFRAILDPANFVQAKQLPFPDCFEAVEPYLTYIHVKDAMWETGKVVPPGEGDGRLKEVLQALKDRNYTGFLSIEPHLASAGTFSGFSGPQLFHVAATGLKSLLSDLEISWS